MAIDYFYSIKGSKSGPVSLPELKKLVENGTVGPNDLVWRDGWSEWKPVRKVKLFGEDSPKNSPKGRLETDETGGVIGISKTIGKIAADALGPGGFDEYQTLAGDGGKSAVYVSEEYFGGRTKIGVSIDKLNNIGSWLGVVIFSWIYLVAFLNSLSSAWQFIPFVKSEYVSIKLGQKVMWRRVFPFFCVWLIIMFFDTVFYSMFITMYSGERTTGKFLFACFIWLLIYVAANILSLVLVLSISNDGLLRSAITFEYGFPRKYKLLQGISDAPIEKQLAGVTKLCHAIAKSTFSPWDQFSTHESHTGSGLVSATLNKIKGLYSM